MEKGRMSWVKSGSDCAKSSKRKSRDNAALLFSLLTPLGCSVKCVCFGNSSFRMIDFCSLKRLAFQRTCDQVYFAVVITNEVFAPTRKHEVRSPLLTSYYSQFSKKERTAEHTIDTLLFLGDASFAEWVREIYRRTFLFFTKILRRHVAQNKQLLARERLSSPIDRKDGEVHVSLRRYVDN